MSFSLLLGVSLMLVSSSNAKYCSPGAKIGECVPNKIPWPAVGPYPVPPAPPPQPPGAGYPAACDPACIKTITVISTTTIQLPGVTHIKEVQLPVVTTTITETKEITKEIQLPAATSYGINPESLAEASTICKESDPAKETPVFMDTGDWACCVGQFSAGTACT